MEPSSSQSKKVGVSAVAIFFFFFFFVIAVIIVLYSYMYNTYPEPTFFLVSYFWRAFPGLAIFPANEMKKSQ